MNSANDPQRSPLAVYPSDMDPGRARAPGGAVKKGGTAAAVLAILAGIYAVEGGYVNDPADRGGATRYGVTEAVARQAGYTGDMRRFPKHCDGPTTACADEVYLRNYVRPFMAVVNVEPALGQELVDTGVNMGTGTAALFWKQALNDLGGFGLPIKGGVTSADMAAYAKLQRSAGPVAACKAMLERLDARQEARYRAIVAKRPANKKFLKGWLNHRIGNVKRSACETGVL